MKVNYGLYDVPNLQSEDKNQKVSQARVISGGTVKTDELCMHISSRSTLSSADVKATLDSLGFWFNFFLSKGQSIELNDLGIFSLGLKSRQTKNEQGILQRDIQVKGIHFRPSVKLKDQIKGFKLEHKERTEAKQHTQEERIKRILDYVQRHHHITRKDVRLLNQVTGHVASVDLQLLVDSKHLLAIGKTCNRIYIKGKNN